MKKTLAILLSLLLVAAVLLTGCAQSHPEQAATVAATEADESVLVYNQSSGSAQNTLVMEDGKTYSFESFEFTLDGVTEADSDAVEDQTPTGKWVCVNLKIVGGSGDGDTLSRLTDDGNILLNGGRAVSHSLIRELTNGELGDYILEVYFDAAPGYALDKAEITCTSEVKEVEE